MLHIGVDLHKRFARVVAVDDAGHVVERQTLYSEDQAALVAYFRPKAGTAVVTVESVLGWTWFYELLDELGVAMKLAHPRKVRMIAESTVKTDTVDALTLAQLERTGYLPESYIPSRPVRDSRELLRYRISLVRIRTGLKNRIQAILHKLNVHHRFTDLFGLAGRRFLESLRLRPVYQQQLDGYLELLDEVGPRIEAVTRQIKAELVPDARAELLMSIPGVAHLTAYLLLAEIGDIRRFPSAKKLCAYAGLVPRVRQSADRCWQGHITREGDRFIRWGMVEAACKAPAKDYALGQYCRRIALRRGPLKARVAVARKLLVAVWSVLTYEEPYCATRPTAV
ncbi:IS110 family transposase [candidate division WOR-3 bacterium]|nr:IS110 family transposase [candidate division WOR-3 bacterium]